MRYTANTFDSFKSSSEADQQYLRQTVNECKKQLHEKKADDREFMKNVLKHSSLYADKKDVERSPEEQKVIDERIEEAEYLETIGTFHWVFYPWIKLVKRMCSCKRKAAVTSDTKKND